VFTEAEALGLVMAVLNGQAAATDTEDPVGAALGKVIQVLPEAVYQRHRLYLSRSRKVARTTS
jgi:hypothetical protein